MAKDKLAFEVEPSYRKYRLRLARYYYHAEALSEILPDGPSRVLDAGCGRGRLPLYLKRWLPPAKKPVVVGMDINLGRLSQAATHGYTQLYAGNITRPWPFKDGTFDVVVCEQVLEHLGDDDVLFALSQIRRVLRPGGVALVGVPIFTWLELMVSPIWIPLGHLMHRLREGPGATHHLQYFSLNRIRRFMERHDLKPERVRGFRLWSFPYGLLEDYEWYYKFHRWFGVHAPRLCGEVCITGRKVDGK